MFLLYMLLMCSNKIAAVTHSKETPLILKYMYSNTMYCIYMSTYLWFQWPCNIFIIIGWNYDRGKCMAIYKKKHDMAKNIYCYLRIKTTMCNMNLNLFSATSPAFSPRGLRIAVATHPQRVVELPANIHLVIPSQHCF